MIFFNSLFFPDALTPLSCALRRETWGCLRKGFDVLVLLWCLTSIWPSSPSGYSGSYSKSCWEHSSVHEFTNGRYSDRLKK